MPTRTPIRHWFGLELNEVVHLTNTDRQSRVVQAMKATTEIQDKFNFLLQSGTLNLGHPEKATAP